MAVDAHPFMYLLHIADMEYGINSSKQYNNL